LHRKGGEGGGGGGEECEVGATEEWTAVLEPGKWVRSLLPLGGACQGRSCTEKEGGRRRHENMRGRKEGGREEDMREMRKREGREGGRGGHEKHEKEGKRGEEKEEGMRNMRRKGRKEERRRRA